MPLARALQGPGVFVLRLAYLPSSQRPRERCCHMQQPCASGISHREGFGSWQHMGSAGALPHERPAAHAWGHGRSACRQRGFRCGDLRVCIWRVYASAVCATSWVSPCWDLQGDGHGMGQASARPGALPSAAFDGSSSPSSRRWRLCLPRCWIVRILHQAFRRPCTHRPRPCARAARAADGFARWGDLQALN